MAESGVDSAAVRLHAELDAVVRALRAVMRDDPDAPTATNLQRRAEDAVGQAVRLLTCADPADVAADPDMCGPDKPTARDGSLDFGGGRVMLTRDLLLAVDLARRAVAARTPPRNEPG